MKEILKNKTHILTGAVIFLVITNAVSLYYFFTVRDYVDKYYEQEVFVQGSIQQINEYKDTVNEYVSSLETYKSEIEVLKKDYTSLLDEYEAALEETEHLTLLNEQMLPVFEKWTLYEKRYGKSDRASYNREKVNISNMEKHRMRITAYTEYECDKEPDHPLFGITASGNRVSEWFTVASGPELAFGTRIYIPHFKDEENSGMFVVEDRGGAIKENCIDVYMPDRQEAIKFGRKWMDVYVIK